MSDQLFASSLTGRSVHIWVDMQRIFSADGPWPTPRMDRVRARRSGARDRHPERSYAEPSHVEHLRRQS